ncbi:TOMM precursor leader peptide-binding protein [Glycomyces sp. TRM65418]|uniref:TOMM precursor leader peptide-binding protein n=1 Tax=Glycomyces sp. TRM65418 TaxID=2867006 RepID=UPI001CE587B1|nr:TOMM precursor leader peptide-binding protein [Glycomyces sp. TRM65418]MCC3765525.1 TOMM precursor leader peptide-binding protein [Glycomyces sp. TRM65418]QZD55132.1 TOMM precursor leader peptide-binding protein [Glycomyces sp. TRM65418]
MTTWLIGEGGLHETLADTLSGCYDASVPSAQDAAVTTGDTVVLARDGWDPERDGAEQQALREAAVLPARIVGDLGIVGPWVRPGTPGCQVCAERRRRLWRRQNAPAEQLDGPVPALALTSAHLRHLAAITDRALRHDLLADREIHVSTGRLTGRIHRMTPLPGCPGCRPVPDDSADLARVAFAPRPQADPESFRTNASGLSGSELRDLVHDWRYGPVGHVYRSENSVMALTSAELALPSGEPGEAGHGRALTYPEGETIALYEALERLSSSSPHGKRTVVRGSQNALPEAVDLRELGLHVEGSGDDPDFRLSPYDPDTPIDWVWGFRLGARRPVLVPEHVAYWHLDRWGRTGPPSPKFLYESSNGCAIGSSVEEASLYGLFEVVERDAFLLAWYTKRPARPLRVDEAEVPSLRGMRTQLDRLGYDLHLFDITTELEIPAVMSLALRRDDDGPVAFFAAGAHCDPRRAVASAATEAVTNCVVRNRMPAETRAEQEKDGRRLIDDPRRVHTLHDHTILYNYPETRSWWSFLDPRAAPATLAEAYGDWRSRWIRPDLTDVLLAVVERMTANGMDPIVVDQTDRITTERTPATVKMIVPQTIPMTFGHVYRRTRGLDRLRSLPVRLGYRDPSDSPVDPDTAPPHPFP